MQVIKNSQTFLKNNSILKAYFSTSPFTGKGSANGTRNAIRFENQNRLWTFDELNLHSNAFGYGLVEMGYKKGDKLLVWVEKSHNAEVVSAQLGAGLAGVTLVPSYASTAEQLEKDLKSSEATGVIYSPNTPAGENLKYSDLMNQVVPQLQQNGNTGKQLKSDKFSKLKYVVHTGFYTQPGQFKYRDILVYASKNFNTLSLPKPDLTAPFILSNNKALSISDLIAKTESLRGTHKLENKTVVVAGDSRSPVSFALGALNSTLHGNYCIYSGNIDLSKGLGKVLELHNDTFLLVDSDLVQNVEQLQWQQSAQDAVSDVALLERGNSGADLSQLFNGKQSQVYNIL